MSATIMPLSWRNLSISSAYAPTRSHLSSAESPISRSGEGPTAELLHLHVHIFAAAASTSCPHGYCGQSPYQRPRSRKLRRSSRGSSAIMQFQPFIRLLIQESSPEPRFGLDTENLTDTTRSNARLCEPSPMETSGVSLREASKEDKVLERFSETTPQDSHTKARGLA